MGAKSCEGQSNGLAGGRKGPEFYLREDRAGTAQARLRGRPPLAPFERAAAALAGEVAWPARGPQSSTYSKPWISSPRTDFPTSPSVTVKR